MTKVKGFTTEWMDKNGFTKDAQGNYVPPVKKKQTADITDPYSLLIPKAKVNDSHDFAHKAVTEWFIPYQVPSKKNSRQVFVGKNGKMMNIPSKSYSTYVAVTKKYWEVFGLEFVNAFRKLELKYPIKVQLTFIRGNKNRFDYTNACQTVEDLMVDFQWIKDDSADHLIPVFEPYIYDKGKPGVMIKILL